MHFSCSQVPFAQKLAIVNRAVSGKSTLSLLAMIKLEAESTHIRLSATNLQWGITTTVGGNVTKSGTLALPGGLLTSYVQALGEGAIEGTTKGTLLHFSSESGTTTMNGASAKDFPPVITELPQETVSIPAKEFFKALAGVSFASALDETRPILTGILFSLKGNTLTLAGVDGFRLSEAVVELPETYAEEYSVVIPTRSLVELSRISSGEKHIQFGISREHNQVVCGIGETVLSARILDGQFPQYTQIIPKESVVTANIPGSELKRAIHLATLFSEGSAPVIRIFLSPEEQSVIVSAKKQEVGETVTKVNAVITGEMQKIAFNAKYLTEALAYFGDDTLQLSLKDGTSPGVFRHPHLPGYTHIIMPVRLTD